MPKKTTPRKSAARARRANQPEADSHRPIASSRETKKNATQRRIVETALNLFDVKGFEHTTTREIARRAKIAEGTLFNYFPTKDDIALHFFELEIDHAIAAVRRNERLQDAPLEEKLFVLVQQQLEYLAPYENFIGSAIVQSLKPLSSLRVSGRAILLRQRYLAFIEELIAESAAGGQPSIVQWIAPSAFWIYSVGVLLYWLYDTSPGKQKTLAFLDRSLSLGAAVLRQEAINVAP